MKKSIAFLASLFVATASFAATTEEPQITVTNDNKVQLSINPEQGVASVSIRDEDGHLIYTDKSSLTNGYNQKFDLSNLKNGAYKLSVSIGNQTIDKTINLGEKPATKQIVVE
ncbi:T9SS type A sorting domain-containing protein [Siphonobacter aquaeclarae]|jgi:cell division protein YceG involved in septum cleavage|uniref:Por secretion system C-terminal sorting domain-containing protein n=1 Tax=Siphonobacter aquaeclarae TaxID=563176 RepID=A0A1G9RK96_9BACT|nr:T9SS type A sorting domain-containing protein [Siphonobacter aquaeclarae]MBO9639737.1 T9SS type A sorting domain-containing protein [Siphonobacter aquaeclarae]SDM23337.1 Por secretion system C-terminal sorting domain-containing protein [Siphonobacter aquaeclarae]